MKVIVVAIETNQDGELTPKAPGTSFYVIPESMENVSKAIERLNREFASFSDDTWSGSNRREIALGVIERGNKLVFQPMLVQ